MLCLEVPYCFESLTSLIIGTVPTALTNIFDTRIQQLEPVGYCWRTYTHVLCMFFPVTTLILVALLEYYLNESTLDCAGGPFNLCEHAIADFRKTQRPGWKPTSTASKSIIPMLVLPGLCSIAYTLLLWLVSQHSSFSSSFEAVDLVDRLPGALAVMVAAHYFCMSMIGQSGDSILQHVSLKDPLGFSAGSVTECQVFRREKHRIGDSEDPEAMQKLLQSMGMGSPVLLAAGSGTVLKPQGKAHSPAAVAKLDKYWSTVLILALWSPDFQKALCNEGNGLFQWRTKGNQGLQYGPISGARLLHCGILVLGRAIIIPRENCTMLYRCVYIMHKVRHLASTLEH